MVEFVLSEIHSSEEFMLYYPLCCHDHTVVVCDTSHVSFPDLLTKITPTFGFAIGYRKGGHCSAPRTGRCLSSFELQARQVLQWSHINMPPTNGVPCSTSQVFCFYSNPYCCPSGSESAQFNIFVSPSESNVSDLRLVLLPSTSQWRSPGHSGWTLTQ